MLALLAASLLTTVPPELAARRAVLFAPDERPSVVLPVAMIAGGSVMSLGGTALSFFGLAVASLRPQCSPPGACDGHLYAGGSMIAGGVLLIAGGLVLAILGHVKWTTRVERWAALRI